MKWFAVVYFLLSFIWNCLAVNFLIPVAFGYAFSDMIKIPDPIKCIYGECCFKAYREDLSDFHKNISQRVVGQPYAVDRAIFNIVRHLENESPRKPLTISFHGTTGTGKNFLSKKIIEYVLHKGMQSKFIHYYDSMKDFYDPDRRIAYIKKIREDLKAAVLLCEKSIFVFDEIHKMPKGVLEALYPYLGERDYIDGLNYRHSIFIFLSNAGAAEINAAAHSHFASGLKREDFDYKSLVATLRKSIIKEKGGFTDSDIISYGMVTEIIPFLPMQSVEVKKCIEEEARAQNIPVTADLLSFVFNEIEWSPPNTQLYSTHGCKLVYEKVGYYRHTEL